jgi:DHA3 family macrolide efflux protein-like MFS transporter
VKQAIAAVSKSLGKPVYSNSVTFEWCFALFGVAWSFVSFLVFLWMAGLFCPVLSAAQTVLVQETVPSEVMGRIFSVIQITMMGAVPIAILFFGPLADVVRIETILMISSALLVFVGVIYGLLERR